MTVLAANGVSVVRGGRPVLTDVGFRSETGALIGLVGPNGAGKTTLLRALAGIQPVRGGTIELFGEPIGGYRPRALARRLAYMPQHSIIHWDLPVRDVVMLGRSPHLGAWSAPGAADREIVDRVMAALDLEALAGRSARALSGGERARVLLGRALAGAPAVLLADEPVAGLDPYHSLEVMDHLHGLARGGALVVVVLHDLSLAMRFCDRLLLLHQGRVAHDGPPEETLDDARLAEVYRIEAQRATRDGKTAIIPWKRLDPPAG
ncbi:MAG: ABC transporter ATP-binding protein [Bauldia litoralis]